MVRKHWQGYGTVRALVLEKKSDEILILVKGNHEYGLIINQGDTYTLAQWLGTRGLGNFREEDIESYTVKCMGYNEEECLYTIKLKAH